MIVAYDPGLHRRFVFSAWCHGAGEPFDRLHRLLRAGARCAVRVGNKNRPVLINGQMRILIMSYLVLAAPQTVVWAYTKPKLRGQGLMKELLEHMGVDRKQPITVLFRSPVSDALKAGGWPITYEGGADQGGADEPGRRPDTA